MSNFLPPQRAAYAPLPEYIKGDALRPGEMLDSLYEEYIRWETGGQYDDGDDIARGERLLEGVYAVVRNIGDRELGADNDEVNMLLTSLQAHPVIRVSTEKNGNLGEVYHHAVRNNMIRADTLAVDLGKLQHIQNPMVQEWLKMRGVYMSDKEALYFMIIRTVAHEAAHVVQGSIGRMAGIGGGEAADFMTSPFAASRGVDTDVVNEGFAEGYAEVVLRKVLIDRGYDEITIENIMHAMSHRSSPDAIERGYLAIEKPSVVGMLESASHAIRQKNQADW
jgi:hypothetical protein